MSLAQQYQRKTDVEHILDAPDTYVGSIENVDAVMHVFDDETNRIVLKHIEFVPAVMKLFDEAIVNARDHVVRMIQSVADNKRVVSYISTKVEDDGTITLENDGNGIDIAKHPEYNIWIPELIFGHLRTSTNYDKEEQKIVGGKNGFGFKLVLIWSTYGRVETVDHVRGLKYVQEFRNNLSVLEPPVITKCKGAKPYTKVVFKPDYDRLKIGGGLTQDMVALLKKRVYDIAAVTDHSSKKIKVSYNDTVVPVKNFQQYIDMYIGSKEEGKRVYESSDDRWEYAVALSETHEFGQVSFVNGICTFKGGKHVDYIMGQICRKLVDYIEKKKKVRVNATAIKEQLILFLRCDIVNPSFDSQTKDCLNTPSNKFGSSCTVSDAFIEKVAKLGVMDLACSITEAKESKLAAKKTDGVKTKTIRGIANFIDANWSGGAQSKDCVLILCEGLSAMSGIVSGLSSEDRNTIGIYPLKGKLLNVRGEQAKKIAENKEITDIKKILGLENGRVYETVQDVHQYLRYGKIMVLTDADADGSHIKGLCVNLLHTEWASLTKIPGFVSFMNTPILRATKGQQKVLFYNQGEYETWKRSFQTAVNGCVDTSAERSFQTAVNAGSEEVPPGWSIKYFKGLGTSTSIEFKEYFANKKVVDFVYSDKSDETIDKVFNKKRADDRKTWLENYDKTSFLDTGNPSVNYEEFIDKELIHFSTYDCARSIPNMVDGLKTSLRKILFCAFKRNLTKEIKVAQFSGYVSEHSAYHHGEASLNGAIIAMAQTFVGSNNINLLKPNGQFGTRLQGGQDSASERYIFTELNPLTRFLFPDLDDSILTYLDDDGSRVEPEYYVPILPFALVNGISGIGTGFSCSIEPYNPLDLVAYLKGMLQTGVPDREFAFHPYYEGFQGIVTAAAEPNKYLIRGVYERIGEDKVRITELPVGTWTMPYISFLETLADGTVDKTGKKLPPVIKDFVSLCTEVSVDITVQFPKGVLATMDDPALVKLLKLATTVSTTNMHMFNAECKLHKYQSVHEICDEFYAIRLATYAKRKAAMVDDMEYKLTKLSNKARYILANLDGSIDLRKKTRVEVDALLDGHQFARLDGDYKYLVKLPMDSVCQESVDQALKEKADTEKALAELKATSCEQMWIKELDTFEQEYRKYREGRNKVSSSTTVKPKAKKVVSKK